jgi:hypothetical protein
MENTEPSQGTETQAMETESTDPREAEIDSLKQQLSQTLAAYRESVVRLNPELPAEMLDGETLEAIDDSVGRARTLVSRVRQSIEAERAAGRVPAGAPSRTEPDYSSLSSREKIQYGIGGK